MNLSHRTYLKLLLLSSPLYYLVKGDHTDIDNILNRVMVFNATFNNISVISWQSVLLMEETGVPGENHRPAASY